MFSLLDVPLTENILFLSRSPFFSEFNSVFRSKSYVINKNSTVQQDLSKDSQIYDKGKKNANRMLLQMKTLINKQVQDKVTIIYSLYSGRKISTHRLLRRIDENQDKGGKKKSKRKEMKIQTKMNQIGGCQNILQSPIRIWGLKDLSFT